MYFPSYNTIFLFVFTLFSLSCGSSFFPNSQDKNNDETLEIDLDDSMENSNDATSSSLPNVNEIVISVEPVIKNDIENGKDVDVKDSTPPSFVSFFINGDAVYTNDANIELSLDVTEHTSEMFMYITNSSDCQSGGEWEQFSSTKTWTLGQTNTTASVYAKVKDAVGNETVCKNAQIVHDNIAPQIVLNNTPSNPSNDVQLNVSVSGEDVDSYQYKLVADGSACGDSGYDIWYSKTDPIIDSITSEGDYRICVIAKDLAGNTSSTDYAWTKDSFWELKVTITTDDPKMKINFTNPVEITVDWGDGEKDVTMENSIEHTYAEPGEYTLRIKGETGGISFYDENVRCKLSGTLSQVQGIKGIKTFETTFADCSNLGGEIPADLFANYQDATSFYATFYNAAGLKGKIPADLFKNNKYVIDFSYTFAHATGLEEIPGELFKYNRDAVDFSYTFAYATNLKEIPGGLFAEKTYATTFDSTFKGATGLNGSIPADLFASNTIATSFSDTFAGASGLTGEIPVGLFSRNTLVTDFQKTFSGAINLEGPAPDLWDTHPNADGSLCFDELTNLTNYNQIPPSWGGGGNTD